MTAGPGAALQALRAEMDGWGWAATPGRRRYPNSEHAAPIHFDGPWLEGDQDHDDDQEGTPG